MPEGVRALVVILALAGMIFFLGKRAFCEGGSTNQVFVRRRNLWLAITLAAFLSFNYWIFLSITAAVLLFGYSKEDNKLALFFSLMFVVPQIRGTIPAMGLLNYLISIDHIRLLAAIVLLPASLALARRDRTVPFGRTLPDKLLASYLILQCILMLRFTTATDAIRKGVVYAYIDTFLPYYVASRFPTTLKQFRDTLTAFTVSALLMAGVGVVENLKHWLLYQPLALSLRGAGKWEWNYLSRGEGLRAAATAGQAIPLGFVITVAMAFLLYLKVAVRTSSLWRAAMALLVGGLIATISRGPWVGAIAMILVYAACAPTPAKNLAKVFLTATVLFGVALATPLAGKIIDLIPFVGTVESGNAEYRRDFIQQSVLVIKQYPWFGSIDFVNAPEFAMLKPQGLLDTLNIFIAIALANGLVGLSLFVGFFVSVGAGIYKAMKSDRIRDPETRLLGQALFAAFIGILVIMNTISDISIIPLTYWCLAGLGVAYANMVRLGEAAPAASEAPVRGRRVRLTRPKRA